MSDGLNTALAATSVARPGRRGWRSAVLGAGLLAGACAPMAPPTAGPATVDVLIRGGTIYDGAGGAPIVGDVGVSGDKVVFVGPGAGAGVRAALVIDAAGMAVTPGFIDPHTHYFEDLTSEDRNRRLNLPAVTQGVTTVFVGSDGRGDPGLKAIFANTERLGIGSNMASFVGFGTVRGLVLGDSDRAPSAAELDRMKALTAQGMCEGALGLSSGLFYAPQSYAKTDEVIAVAREAARRGGVFDSHIRDESSYTVGLKAAVQEVLDIARGAGLAANIAHIKALGVDVHGQSADVIAMIERAQAAGLVIHADQYPWVASGSGIAPSLLPRWAQVDGEQAMLKRLTDPALGPRIRTEMRENLRRRGGPEAILLTSGAPKELLGRTLGHVAAEWKVDPVEAAVRILQQGGSSIASFNMTEGDVRAFMRRPWVMTSSDGSDGHPRKYGSFAMKYAKYVKGEKVISMSDFVRRSSGLTADNFKIQGRGYLRPGYFADVLVLDPERYAPRATYVQPEVLSEGAAQVLVNGRFAVRDGKPTGETPGRALPKTPTAGTCP